MKTFDPTTRSDSDDKRFDPLKPAQTRDGRKARILATDIKGCKPLLVVSDHANGKDEIANLYYENGKVYPGTEIHCLDLVNVPVKVERWINIYPELDKIDWAADQFYLSKAQAILSANKDRIDTIKIEWELP